jgi:hypothetical protein
MSAPRKLRGVRRRSHGFRRAAVRYWKKPSAALPRGWLVDSEREETHPSPGTIASSEGTACDLRVIAPGRPAANIVLREPANRLL